ncbi:hypothetical protein DZC75_10960 [Pseudomonas parafulva]|uniref:Uncharacterized protein n=1 Tax=Pseudomonas parafulva TaxID=157782 RepID=A0AAI8K948_9PSED|nr:hypothetical protein DZC75_10960 [Pseudomonas parafulva]
MEGLDFLRINRGWDFVAGLVLGDYPVALVGLSHLFALTATPFFSWKKGGQKPLAPASGPFAALRGSLAPVALRGYRA